jgi:hypothetical protein
MNGGFFSRIEFDTNCGRKRVRGLEAELMEELPRWCEVIEAHESFPPAALEKNK